MRVWIRYDPSTEEVFVEDEAGNEYPQDVVLQRDGVFYLIGPLDIEDP